MQQVILAGAQPVHGDQLSAGAQALALSDSDEMRLNWAS